MMMQQPSRRQREKKNHLKDDTVFDNTISPCLPIDVTKGRNILLVSFALQALLILFAFLSHHHKRHEFNCCNGWALLVGILFLALQYPYYSDWCGKFGSQALWHRANMFAPYIIVSFLFLFWLGGTLSMLAHAIGAEFFEIALSSLSTLEELAFVVCTAAVVPGIWLLVVLAHTHRNNLGLHYYAPKETPNAFTLLFKKPYPTEGSFNYRNTLGKMATICGVETSEKAEKNIKTVVGISILVQAVFYSFAGAVYSENQTVFLIILVGLGCVLTLFQIPYFMASLSSRSRQTRKWNRSHLLLPMHALFLLVITYFGSMSTMFFRASNDALWEDIILDLEGIEKFYFAMSFIIMVSLLVVQLTLVNIHRKAWAENTQHIDDGLEYTRAVGGSQANLYDDDESYTEEESDSGITAADDDDYKRPRDRTPRAVYEKDRAGDDIDISSESDIPTSPLNSIADTYDELDRT